MKLISSLFLTLFIFACSSSSRSHDDKLINQSEPVVSTSTYVEAVVDAAVYESQNPTEFLSSTGTYRPNFGGDKMVINGQIQNSATKTTYKDVVVEFIYYTQTDTELGRERRVFYEYYSPGRSKDFKLRMKVPRAAKKMNWDIISAVTE